MAKKQKIDWKKGGGLIPAIVQDADTNAVLMLGYMNRAALTKTQKTKKVWFFSRSKKRLWMKGEFSHNILEFVSMAVDCDRDALLIKARPSGPTCHTGDYSCFGPREQRDLQSLFSLIEDRKARMPQGSYSASLFSAGINKIALKVAEESLEIVQAAQKESKKRVIEEAADLVYHLFALLVERGVRLGDIDAEMKKRARARK